MSDAATIRLAVPADAAEAAPNIVAATAIATPIPRTARDNLIANPLVSFDSCVTPPASLRH